MVPGVGQLVGVGGDQLPGGAGGNANDMMNSAGGPPGSSAPPGAATSVKRPTCCNKPMLIRENQQKRQFWGCHKYPHCTNTENPRVYCMFCGAECRFRRKANSGYFACPKVECRFKRQVTDVPPVCIACQDQFMEVRKKQATGQKFWGCLNFPACKGSRQYMGTL